MLVEVNDKAKGMNANAGKSVCTMSIPDIIGALHEKALEECKAESSGITLTNSAFSKDGTLETAGDHMICAATGPNSDVDKAGAVKILQSYVQWFAGPDIAKKVTDGTVNEILADDEGNGGEDLKESKCILPFRSWLVEASKESSTDDTPEFEDSIENDSEENNSRADDVDFDDASDDGADKDNNKDNDNKDTATEKDDADNEKKPAGYYVGYSLNVEGMKKSTADDAMKSTSILWKYAKTFFDGMKITFTKLGSGGSGESFTVKDIKNAFGETFGKIDPNKLVSNVEHEIHKRYPNTPAIVEVRDQNTLLSEIGDQLTGEDKAKIAKSKYALRIDVTKTDPKKDILTKAEVADIVTSSISGLWKKFTSGISRNDVVYIKDFADIHRKPEELKKLQNLVPDHVELSNLIHKTPRAGDVYDKLKKAMDKIDDHRQKGNSKLVSACLKIWDDLKAQFDKDKKRISSLSGKAKNEFFKPFIDNYEKAYKKYYDKSLNESINALCQPMFIVNLKKLVLENFTNLVNEKSEAEPESVEFSPQKIDSIKKFATKYLRSNVEEPKLVDVDRKDILKEKCKILDLPSDFNSKFGDFKQGILVDFTGDIEQTSSSLLESFNASVKNDILSILGEADDNVSASSTATMQQIDSSKVYTALATALEKNGIEDGDYASSLIEINQVSISPNEKSLDESSMHQSIVLEDNAVDHLIDKNKWTKKQALNPDNFKLLKKASKQGDEKTTKMVEKHFIEKKPTEKNAYILPFGKEEHIPVPTADVGDGDVDSGIEGTGGIDVYIVPMPKLGYTDDKD